MLNNKRISLVVPCKNEASSLPSLFKLIPTYVDEVVIVDNNSTDDTIEVAKKLGAVVVSEKRKDKRGIGYGYAHKTGLSVSTGDYIVTMDGDGTYPPHHIRDVVCYMEDEDLDFVTCTRFPLLNHSAISKTRQLGVWILNTEVKLLYWYPMSDILSGMWVMQRSVIDKLSLTEGGWDFSPEIKLEAFSRPDVSFGQYHINHKPRDNGASKQKLWETGINHMKYILRRRLTKDNPFKTFSKKAADEAMSRKKASPACR